MGASLQTIHTTNAQAHLTRLGDDIAALADADFTALCFARVGIDGEVISSCFAPRVPEVAQHWDRFHTAGEVPFFVRNRRRVDTLRFVDDVALLGPEGMRVLPIHQVVHAPVGVEHQTRVIIANGGTVGLLGAYRCHTQPFSQSDNLRLTQSLTHLRDQWCIALRMLALPELGADLIVRPDGTIEAESSRARSWIDVVGFRDAIAQVVVNGDRGVSDEHCVALFLSRASARVTRLEGVDSTKYLVHIERTGPFRESPFATLTPRRRDVAERCAMGMTLVEVARELSISRETAKKHLDAVYDQFGIASRAELAHLASKLHR